MSRWRSPANTQWWLTVAAVAVILLLWARLLVVQPRASEYARSRDPQQVQIAERRVDQLSSAVGRLTEASRQGKAGHMALPLSAADINALLAAQPDVRGALEAARIRDPEVRLRKGRVITTAMVERAGITTRVTAEGELSARGGMLVYASDTVSVAGLPAPAPIRAAVDARIREAFRQLEVQQHARVDRVVVRGDRITLYLSSQPE